MSPSCPEDLYIVVFQDPIMGNEGQAFGLRLGDQHAIEWVSMVVRQAGDTFGVSERDEELLKAAGENPRFHRIWELEAAYGGFDRRLPG